MQILFRNRKLHPKCICFEHFGYALFALYDSVGKMRHTLLKIILLRHNVSRIFNNVAAEAGFQ